MMKPMAVTLLALLSATTALADDFAADRLHNWHQWRGPQSGGSTPYGDPPLHWDESTNVQWKVRIPGSGSATPIVWDDRVFVLSAIDTGRLPAEPATSAATFVSPIEASNVVAKGRNRKGRGGTKGANSLSVPTPTSLYRFEVLCLNRATGETLWQRTAVEEVPHEGHHPSHGYASASPTTDGRRVYASFGSRGVFCYDLDGNFQWKRDLGQMETKRGFGEGASPVLHGDKLVVNWDHEGDSFIVCLSAITGEELWRTPRDEPTTWATPLVVEHEETTQVVVNGTGRTRSYDIADGKLLWECGGQVDNPIPSPVARDGVVYCMSGYQGYAITAISLDARGDVTGSESVLWKYDTAAPYIASPLLYDNLLYFTKGDVAILGCLDANSGALAYGVKRLDGLGTIYASPVGAAGRVYLTDRDGTTLVIERGPEFKVLATNKLEDVFNASAVVVGNQLLLRGEKFLYSIAVNN